MDVPDPRLRIVPLFDGLSDDDLARICRDSRERTVAAGEVIFQEGETADGAYVITGGEVEIVKATHRREVLLAVRNAGDVIGEMALLQEEPRNATARARTTVELLTVPRASMDELLETSPTAARAVFRTFVDRMRATNDQVRQSERMAQLGTLTAGVAHELNNPAAAVARAASRIEEPLAALVELAAGTLHDDVGAVLLDLVDSPGRGPTDALERNDAEVEVEDWLTEHEVDEAWELAPTLVDAGVTVDDLDALANGSVELPVRLLAAAASLRRIAEEIGEGTRRLSAIVRALKSYTHLDQSPVQDVDVHQGIEDTLVLLAHRTRGVEVVRDYGDDVPTIQALGTELNQVWTNLIDNACDAVADADDPRIVLRTRRDDDTVVVVVEDNGHGIPADVRGRIFDAFFTTKPPGQGTGLGLQISYRIVALEHRGDLTVESEPGHTVFRVTLPITTPTSTR